jgi:hypothetical protein
MGDEKAWEYLGEISENKNSFFSDPRIVYCVVQNILDMPVIMKEMMAENEWFEISEELVLD